MDKIHSETNALSGGYLGDFDEQDRVVHVFEQS